MIVGAGQAGYQVAESLRTEGWEGAVTLIGEEPYLPYQRPPLSKDYLLGKTDSERILYRPREFYDQSAIDLRLGTRVETLDAGTETVTLSDGEVLEFSALVLATGARVRPLDIPGADLAGVHSLRTLKDIDAIGARLETARRVVVIGAGFIGLEFAAVARTLGKQVQVLEAMDRVMARVVQPELSEFFTRLHESHGVEIVCGAQVSALTGESGAVQGVTTADGQVREADLVVVGIGVLANQHLAEQAGIACGNGIIVDRFGETSRAGIFACGDCASYEHPFAGQAVRLESVQNAGDQARAVAAKITGKDKPYVAVPWFWSDQYDVKLQMAGLTIGCDDHVVRGDSDSGRFSLLHYKGERLRAVEAISSPRDYIVGRMLLEKGLSPDKQQAADPGFNLKSLLS